MLTLSLSVGALHLFPHVQRPSVCKMKHLLSLPLVVICVVPMALSAAIDDVTKKQWKALNDSVDGRLFAGVPFARPCFPKAGGKVAGKADEAGCAQVMQEYNNASTTIPSRVSQLPGS